MTDKFKLRMVRLINGLKEETQAVEDFMDDVDHKALYIALLTVEGAIMFNDLDEFAEVCSEFCQKKSRDLIISG